MEIENRLKTPLTDEQDRAARRIAEIAARGWPVPGGGMVQVGALELVERTLGGSRDELVLAFTAAGLPKLVLPRGALEAAVEKLKRGEL